MDAQSRGSHGRRNWTWWVPVAGLAALAMLAGFAVLIASLVIGMIKSSDIYQDALARAKAHPTVQTVLGSPVQDGLFISGNLRVSGPRGQASLAIPISGPGGRATICVEAVRSAGRWRYSTLEVEIRGGQERINLLESMRGPSR